LVEGWKQMTIARRLVPLI